MMIIRPFEQADFPELKEIYQQGIDTGNATFQTSAKNWPEWDASVLAECRLVAVENGQLTGWAALAPVSSRCAYTGVAEASVYVATSARRAGTGHQLLSHLATASEDAGIWTLNAGIFPENEASIALFTKNGFRIVGTQHKLGKMQDKWRDVVSLERRSGIVGID